MEVSFAIYDTQGVRFDSGGPRVPTFSDLGIGHGDVDSLGVWLAVRRVQDRAIIGMRVDHLFESGGMGRDNRYIIILEVPLEGLEKLEKKFGELMGKILEAFQEKYNVVYKGKNNEPPEVSDSVINDIVELIDELPNYSQEILKGLGLRKEGLKVRIDGLDYDDPGIGDRWAALKVMVGIIKKKSESPLTELIVFSKTHPIRYRGLWIVKDARTPEVVHLLLNLEKSKKEFSECKSRLDECRESLKECEEERRRLQREIRECQREKRELKRSRGIAKPIAAIGAVIMLLIGVFGGVLGGLHFAGNGLSLLGHTLVEKPAKITPVKGVELKGLLDNASSLPKNSPAINITRRYIEFINTSQRTKSINFREMAKIVGQDIALHRKYSEELNKRNKEIKTLTDANKKLQSQLDTLKNLNGTVVSFENETKYFTLMCGNGNITLTEADIKELNKHPGIKGWNEVMRNHCIAKLKEVQKQRIIEVNRKIEYLEGKNGTMKKLEDIYNISLSIEKTIKPWHENGTDSIFKNFTLFVDSINSSLKELRSIVKEWEMLRTNVSANVSNIQTCRDAYKKTKDWDVNAFETKTVNELREIQAVKIVESLYELAKVNQTEREQMLKDAPDGVKGLVEWVRNEVIKFATINSEEDFWDKVVTPIIKPPENSIESIRNSLESLLELVKRLEYEITGGGA